MEDNKKENQNGQVDANATNQGGPKPADFGSAGVDDINRNMGQFTNTVHGPESTSTSELKLDVDSSVVDKASKETINFERFDKTKKEKKHSDKPNTRFGEKISMMLRSKKGLRTTWILEMVIMVVIIAVSAGLIAWLTPYLSTNTIKNLYYGVTKTGIVFLWISMFPCLVPLIYLLTTWFIGINQVASSKMYHVFFWIAGGVSLFCLILGLGLCGKAMELIIANPHLNLFISSIL